VHLLLLIFNNEDDEEVSEVYPWANLIFRRISARQAASENAKATFNPTQRMTHARHET